MLLPTKELHVQLPKSWLIYNVHLVLTKWYCERKAWDPVYKEWLWEYKKSNSTHASLAIWVLDLLLSPHKKSYGEDDEYNLVQMTLVKGL